MPPLSPLTSASAAGGGGSAAAHPAKVSERDDFLQLLVTQLRHQDPLNPLEGSEFAAQLAQFSSLEQLRNIGGKLDEGMAADLLLARSINNTMASTMIGKSVRALSETIRYDGRGGVDLKFEIAEPASRVSIDIMTADGRIIRTLSATELDEGEGSLEWDGRDARGNRVPAGTYELRVTAYNAAGGEAAARPILTGRVTGVKFIDGNPVLLLGDQLVPFGNVISIEEFGGDNGESVIERVLRFIH